MNSEVDIQLSFLQEKIKLLLKQYQQLQKNNLQLQKELSKVELIKESQANEINVLQQKVDIKNIGIESWKDSDKKELEKRIDNYLKDIEQCLVLINTA